MRRYDERQTLAAKLASNTLDRDEIVAVAQTIAAFHEGAQVVHSRERPVMAAERRFELNAHELMLSVDHANELGRVLALERFAHAFITAHADTLEARTSGGLVREGHGDIRAEHVLLVGGVQIVDCVEFDRALRELDVADDLAFLVVDLFANGGSELADQLVNAYRRAGGDTGGDALIAFYAAYRALVRAKVALIRSQQRGPNGPDSQAGRSEAGRLLALAESFAWRARLPLVIVVCGVPASGKSHLTRAIGAASGLPQLSADATRKRLLGIGQNERAPEEAYTKQFNGRTYAELGDAASVAVATRRGAIVDATFRHRADREAFTQAFANAGPLLYVECQAPAAVLVTRAMDRDRSSDRLSDADVSVVRRERSSWEPLDEVTPAAHVAIRTDRTTDAVLADLMALLDRRLAALQPAQ
jgi:predicted kinase